MAAAGAFDWDNLLTQDGASYEPGVFDVRGGQSRPTALYPLVHSFNQRDYYPHPVLVGPGW